MRPLKVVSGGQTGVDRAALDVALRLGLPCGGWCPKGRLAEDGPIPPQYPLKETLTSDYAERTAANVRDSDATLVLTWGTPTEGTAFTIEVAGWEGKPCRVVDLAERCDPASVAAWMERRRVRTLNVAGPRASKIPGVYEDAVAFLEALLGPMAA